MPKNVQKSTLIKNQYSQLRIIAGKYKSRKISFPTIDPNLRPTSDRLRETLFNWLMPYIVNARCLDAFAGSGALGFEALSRLAHSCDLFELDKNALAFLNQNTQRLNIGNAHILHANVLSHLQNPINYDIIFLDPPFKSELLDRALNIINHNIHITTNTIIYTEFATKSPPKELDLFEIIKQTQQGDVSAYLLYKKLGSR
ncbi:16S rRNA (guanine(966)-N(2))-methyltransferase RsmD [Fastidiosibacter lacustris]|uniref:16S rRNA (guanine(966)-N(2))-methyltransferase RsmD n=1 Tax=Fastidiosibacter lacustris TaxID=2056695 RepID=UPI0013004A0F|nr:16S rRNA (guanine(966)-N(2))-methyltransferase RsmD [Fastidiosibacter lacustris]